MKNGLILEGGAMRGMFSCGVLDVFMENNISFDGAIGVSAGACFGCNIKSKQPGRAIRYNKRFCNDKRYVSVNNWIKTGNLFGVDFCYHEIPFVLDQWDNITFAANPMEFYVVCTDVETGLPFYHKCTTGVDEDLQYIRASASMPLASKVVEYRGRKLLDGGVADSIPVRFFESIGYSHNIVILTQPKGYIKEKNRLIPVAKLALRKYPAFIEAFENRHVVYNDTIKYIEQLEATGKLLVIRPEEKLPNLTHDSEVLEHSYQHGRQAGERYLERVKQWVSNI